MAKKHGGKRKGAGRRGYDFNERDHAMVRLLCACGIAPLQIRHALAADRKDIDAISKSSFYRLFGEDLETGRMLASAKVAHAMFINATENMNFQAQKYWLQIYDPETWGERSPRKQTSTQETPEVVTFNMGEPPWWAEQAKREAIQRQGDNAAH